MTDDNSIKVIFHVGENSPFKDVCATTPPASPTTQGRHAAGSTVREIEYVSKRFRAAREQSFWNLLDTYSTDVTSSQIKASEQVRNRVRLPGPDPRVAQTPEEFVSRMRQLRAYTGLTLRQISERAGVHSELPRSTLGDVLNKKALPKDTILRHFLRACGLTDEQAAVWESTRRRIAMEEAS